DTAANETIATIPVGDEPRSIAIDSENRYAFVANAADSSVTVLRILEESPVQFEAVPDERISPTGELVTGAEPWSVVVSPDGRRAFVANSGQDTITVIDVAGGAPQILGQVDLRRSLCNPVDSQRRFQPFGLAVNEDNRQLYTARLLSFTPGSGVQGDDEGKVGLVCRLDIDTASSDIAAYQPAARIRLGPQVTGFQFPGFAEDTSAFPNQLQSIVIRGNRAYLPNIAASPSAPLRFNVDTHSFVNIIGGVNTDTQADRGALNLHLGARDPEGDGADEKKRLFFANPWAIAFTTQSGFGDAYVVSAASDLLVKLNVNTAGRLSFTEDDDTTRYIDLNDPENPQTAGANAGKNPRGIVITEDGQTAYVANFVSRNVSVVDLTSDEVVDVIPTSDPPAPGSEDEVVQVGAEMFFSSRGHFDRPDGTTVSTDERLSSEGWQNCASCHFEGLTDGVVFVFGTGPRKSVPLNASFNPARPNRQRVLNYSAIFDEIEDFEINIRNVSGPGNLANGALDPNHGLLIGDNGNINQAPGVVNAFAVPNAGRPQHTVTLPNTTTAVPALTALREWVQFAVRTPNGPLTNAEVPGGVPQAQVDQGRALFDQQGCDNCHSGDQWTTSIKDFTSPPAANEIFTETNPAPLGGTNPVGAQYLDRFLEDIGSFNLGVPGQGNPIATDVGADERANPTLDANGQLVFPDALGIDYNGDGRGEGFNVPSLLG
ncbi:MAG TPA: beta-propeller fold lactonase family protein, partial [Acidimicrobiia bacterium]|nr:beta-propeller fold lactonase family protein [Acidimicrobiia bacterium]